MNNAWVDSFIDKGVLRANLLATNTCNSSELAYVEANAVVYAFDRVDIPLWQLDANGCREFMRLISQAPLCYNDGCTRDVDHSLSILPLFVSIYVWFMRHRALLYTTSCHSHTKKYLCICIQEHWKRHARSAVIKFEQPRE